MDSRSVSYMAATIWGEARGEPMDGKRAVGWVIRNRAEHGGWWGDDIVSVCTKPKQFSCWNDDDPNSEAVKDIAFSFGRKATEMLADKAIQDCVCAALEVLNEHVKDETGGATHYHASRISPGWTSSLDETARIGRHVFYV